MFKSIYINAKKIKIGNLFLDRLIKLSYTILSLYLGANFFIHQDFFILQQITLFQSFLLFAISLPVNSILIRLGSSSITYFKSLLVSTITLRLVLGIASTSLFGIYIYTSNMDIKEMSLIIFGLLPLFLSTIFITEVIPHVFNFEGRKNWELIYIYLFFFLIKCLLIIFFKSIFVKICIELIEVILVILWNYKVYLRGLLQKKLMPLSSYRVKKLVKSSAGLYFNGILSVFILRIDQFALIKYVDKFTLSSYMLIVSITSLFLTPMGLISEKIAYSLSIARSESLPKFNDLSIKYLFRFLFLSCMLYCLYLLTFVQISQFVFKRNLTDYFLVAVILGTSIISNSIGMIFGQLNSIINGGAFTMKRSLIGCLLLFIGVSFGFQIYGVLGVAIASSVTLFFTNVILWFFSSKVRRIIFYKLKVK